MKNNNEISIRDVLEYLQVKRGEHLNENIMLTHIAYTSIGFFIVCVLASIEESTRDNLQIPFELAMIIILVHIIFTLLFISIFKELIFDNYLFSLDLKYKNSLKEGIVDEEFKKAFKDHKQSLSSKLIITKTWDKNWEIRDLIKEYRIEITETQLNIYYRKISSYILGIILFVSLIVLIACGSVLMKESIFNNSLILILIIIVTCFITYIFHKGENLTNIIVYSFILVCFFIFALVLIELIEAKHIFFILAIIGVTISLNNFLYINYGKKINGEIQRSIDELIWKIMLKNQTDIDSIFEEYQNILERPLDYKVKLNR